MNYIDLLKKMKNSFPTWMDIRRKIKTSIGGNLLHATAEEISEIQYEIEKYRREFFVDNYLDSCESIVDFLYVANIGSTGIENIKVENYQITDNQKLFYDNEKIAYYEDGFIYVKENIDSLKIQIYESRSEYELQKEHVWNIYDEFATFLGLRRYENECNKELLNRMLSYSNGKANSTEDGLKHAIISDLINIDSSITNEDILIERQTAKSLLKYYNDFETILDKLSDINKDVFMKKRWDVDTWKLDVNKINYIPHAWDVALSAYCNGIGFDEDLDVKLIDDKQETEVTLTFYKKQIEAINAYIQNNNIKEKVQLKLRKYDNSIKPDKVRYRITASPAKKVNVREINIESIEDRVGRFSIPISEIASQSLFAVSKTDRSILDSAYNYKIDLVPINPLKTFFIESLSIDNDGETTNLLDLKPGFEYHNAGIKNSKTRAFIEDKYLFSNFNNIDKEVDGFVLSDLTKPGFATIKAGKYKNKKLFCEYDCKKASVLLKDIKMNNCYLEGDKIVADTVNDEKSIEINIEANDLEFTISGDFSIECQIDKGEINTINNIANNFKFSIEHSPVRKNVRIFVRFNQKGNLNNISNMLYSSYDLEVRNKNTQLKRIDDYYIIPNDNEAEVVFKVESFTGFSPCIKWIYIGEKLGPEDGIYGTEIVTNGKSKLNIKAHNCKINLHKLTKNGEAVSTTNDFKPFIFYKSEGNNEQIELFLNSFTKIESMSVESGSIETVSYNSSHLQHILKLEAKKEISHINVSGKRRIKLATLNMHDILSSKGYDDTAYDFYCAKDVRSIITKSKSTGAENNISITRSDICKGDNISIVSVINKDNSDIVPVFFEDESKGMITVGNESNSNFDIMCFTPVNSKKYIAINEHDIIFSFTNNIDIVNTFNNDYDDEKGIMFYSVESLDDKFLVRFKSSGSFDTWKTSILELHKIAIKRKTADSINCNYVDLSITKELPLASSIKLPETIIMDNNEIIDLNKYMIINNENVMYLNRYTDMINEDRYRSSEKLIVDDLMVSKLKYSNINEIESIKYDGEDRELIDGIDYDLHKNEGIITWNSSSNGIKKGEVMVIYNFNIAKAIKMDIDSIYKKIQYDVLGYKKIGDMKIDRVIVNSGIELYSFDLYKEADLINVKCKDVGFDAIVKDGILTIDKNAANNTISVKAGYYYMNEAEHYIFANENFDEIEKIDNLHFHNVEKKDKQFIFKQPTINNVVNSAFNARSFGDIHFLNCNDKNIDGVSVVNAVTACDSFNHWSASTSILSIIDAYNGVGMEYKPILKDATFCYLSLSEFTEAEEEYTVSYYIKNKGKSYLGRETTIYSGDSVYNKQGPINIVREAEESKIISNIYSFSFKQDSHKYYLILEGHDVIDDIIITKKRDHNINMHVKNVTSFNLNVAENIYSSYSTRFYLSDKKSSRYNGTEMKDGKVINSSFIHWGYTTIKSFNSKKDFQECGLENIELISAGTKAAVLTGSEAGKVMTKEIFLGNIKTINNVVIKINDVMFSNMKGFKVKVLTANNNDSDFKVIQQSTDNIISINGKILSSYIKILVEMPQHKVISNIDVSVEYLSEGENSPADKVVLSGEYVTKIYDAQYTANFRIIHLKISEMTKDLKNYIFYVRATKENTDLAVWTDWKKIELKKDIESYKNIANSVTFEGYRFFQFKAALKGADASINLEYLDLEVI